jgi:hypothetical protein
VSAIGQDQGGSAAPATTQGAQAPTDPGQGGAPQGEPQGGGGFDYDRIEQMLDSRFGQMDERVGGLEQHLAPQQQAPPEQEPDPFAPLADAGYAPEEIQQLQGVLSPLFQGVVQQAMQPLQQQNQQLAAQLAALTNDLDAGDLVDQYPALGTDEGWNRVAPEALALAQSLGLQVQRPEEVPARIIETVHLAQLGRERVASETPAGGGNPGLETAGGATPPEPPPDIAKSIVNARGGQKTPQGLFWGFQH